MSVHSFATELNRFGPRAIAAATPMKPRHARAYCWRLARRHYENFTAVSWLTPRALRQHLANVYAYCRWADDLADETGNAATSLQLLDWWQAELQACYAGNRRHPVFIALGETIDKFAIPIDPFVDLLVAFRQDQRITRYETLEQLLQYCRYSANPVGRLVLCLGECASPQRMHLSDCICTGLQLANFCQDVAGDLDRGRIYLPLVDAHRFGYNQSMFLKRECNEAFRQLLSAEVDQAEGFLHEGEPLVRLLPWDLRLPVAAIIEGGKAILAEIRRQNFDVWTARPRVSTMNKLRILAGCWWRLRKAAPVGNEV